MTVLAIAQTDGIIQRTLRAYLPLFILWAVYYGGARTVLDEVDAPITFELVDFLPSFLRSLPFFLIGVMFFAYFRLFVFRTDETAFQRIGRWGRETPWLEFFALRLLPVMIYIYGLQNVYVALKPAIPDIVPFSWDPLFAAWDRMLLFGHDAWVLTHGLFEGAYAASVIDQLYTAWFYTLFGCIFVCGVLPLGHRARLAYLVAFALDWGIGGSFMATVFSSAGPVYYERIFGDPVFSVLLERLHLMNQEIELGAVVTIELLWDGYVGVPDVPPLGISAFPSLHLGIAATNACFAFTFGRAWGWAMVLFTGSMLFGSVHLGWHYLVDGLFGIALGWAFWVVAWRFSGRWLTNGGAAD